MATTEKMLPGIMPGISEINLYQELYTDPAFTLIDRISNFDSSSLSEKYRNTFCARYPQYTGVGSNVGDWISGTKDIVQERKSVR